MSESIFVDGGGAAAGAGAERNPSHPAFTPPLVLVGLSQTPRDWEDAALPSDRAALSAAEALARGFRCPCVPVFVPPDQDGVTRADTGLARRVADAVADLAERGGEPRDAPLLVVGSQSSQPVGTTARSLLVDPPCAVWVQRGPWNHASRVVVALERLDPRDRPVRVGLGLARSLDAEFALFHQPERRGGSGHAPPATLEGPFAETKFLSLPGGGEYRVLLIPGTSRSSLLPHITRAEVAVLGRGRRRGLGRILDGTARSRTGPFVVVP